MNLAEAIIWKWPGAEFVVRGGVLERWDGPMVRPSDAEITQATIDYTPALANTQQFTAKSRQKDLLADAAARVRSRDIPTWNGMTLAQKKNATTAEADVWANIRGFVEDNL